MVSSGVVWCLKDNRWIPLQLSSIRLHGALTEVHWAAISDFLQRFANKQLILQENGFTELTEEHKELLFQHQNPDVLRTNPERKTSLGQIPEDKVVEQPRRPSMPELHSIRKQNLFIDDNLLNKETDKYKQQTDKNSQNDELVLRLLKKYCQYSRDALDDEIINALDKISDNNVVIKPRVRKTSYVPKESELYENCFDIDNGKNEHLIWWLNQQNRGENLTPSTVRKLSQSSSGFASLSSQCSTNSRKSSVDSGSFSETEENNQWLLKCNLSSKNEKRLKKQREAWARNRRKLSDASIEADCSQS